MKLERQVTKELYAACRTLGDCAPERQSTVPERAREVVAATYPGQWLKVWQVEVMMCLITRLECYEHVSPNSWREQQAVLDAWKATPSREAV